MGATGSSKIYGTGTSTICVRTEMRSCSRGMISSIMRSEIRSAEKGRITSRVSLLKLGIGLVEDVDDFFQDPPHWCIKELFKSTFRDTLLGRDSQALRECLSQQAARARRLSTLRISAATLRHGKSSICSTMRSGPSSVGTVLGSSEMNGVMPALRDHSDQF